METGNSYAPQISSNFLRIYFCYGMHVSFPLQSSSRASYNLWCSLGSAADSNHIACIFMWYFTCIYTRVLLSFSSLLYGISYIYLSYLTCFVLLESMFSCDEIVNCVNWCTLITSVLCGQL